PGRRLRRARSQHPLLACLAEHHHLLLCRRGGLLAQLRRRSRLAAERQNVHLRHRRGDGDRVAHKRCLWSLATARTNMTNGDPDGAIMAPREMAGSTTQTEQDELQAAGLYTPPLHHRRASGPSVWDALLQARERRWWVLALVATVLVSATAIGLIYADDAG